MGRLEGRHLRRRGRRRERVPEVRETEVALPERLLAWDACYNARDVGGYATADGGAVRWRALVRADNLCRLTPEGSAAPREYGVSAVVDLRRDHEIAAAAHPLCDTPLYRRLDLDESNPELMAFTPDEYYARVLDRRPESFATVVETFVAAPDGAVVFHCHSGKDRTGIVTALLLDLAGVGRDTIVEDYMLSDRYLAPYREWYVGQGPNPEERRTASEAWRARPERIEAFLDRLAELGGAESYLRSTGLSVDDVARAKGRLR